MRLKLKKGLSHIAFFAGICLLLASCATNKDALPNKVYHAMNTRFNVFFNGNESFKEGRMTLDKNTKDNYTSILPVYIYPPKTEALSQSPQWDRSIEKCSKAIAKHSMLIKGEEKNIFMDEVYMLMGKAYFYRQDYQDALRVFNYVSQNHKGSNSWLDSYSWKAQTYLCLQQIPDAEENLELIKADVGVSKSRKEKMHWEAVYTDKLIRQENYEQAAVYMQDLLSNIRWDRPFKTRCKYIYAQLNQELGQFEEARKYYKAVAKRAPNYEMAFNANLNLALCGIEKSETKHNLERMLKDHRNDEYRDQIFYALAQIDFFRNDSLAGIRNLEASAFWSVSNQYQKAVSSLDLAEYYYEHQDYENAQKYYDTLMANLPEHFPNRALIFRKAQILKNLVTDLMTIKTQDSLQRVANMSETEREAYIQQQIAAYKEREEERLADEAAKAALMSDVKKLNAGNKKSTWVFYNPTQVKTGEQQFRKEWGPRVLEDNWFLSNKTSMLPMVDEEEDGSEADSSKLAENQQTTSSNPVSDPNNPAYYMQNVPLTPDAVQQSNDLIAFAYYNSGFTYYDDLKDKPAALTQWSSLADRFPQHKLYPSACYLLYRTYEEMKNPKADYYKKVILTQFPESEYALIIQNPNYFQELASQQEEVKTFYAATYQLYEKRQYKELLKKSSEGLKQFVDPVMRSKFAYLQAYAKGKTMGVDSMQTAMRKVCTNFPNTAVDTLANGILEAIARSKNPAPSASQSNGNGAVRGNQPPQEEDKPYLYDAGRFHFVIVLVNIKDIKINQLKVNVANFNKEYFRMYQFDVSNFYIDNTTQMLTISRFENKSKAMEYYYQMKKNSNYFGEINKNPNTKIYVISDQNYTLFFKQKKKRAEYEKFFTDNYLNIR